MTRLINADELKDWSEIIPLTDDGGIDINDFEEKLRTMPTIDAVPVEFIRSEMKNSSGVYYISLRILLDTWAERKEENGK